MANRPGQLAALARSLGNAGVNIEALAAFATGEEGVVRLVADDEAATRQVLTNAGLQWEEHRVISTRVHNRPGALAHIAESLAGTGVNIDSMYLLHSNGDYMQFALAVNDPDAAVQHLSF